MRVPQQLFTGVRRDRDHAGGARERSLSRCGIGEVVTRLVIDEASTAAELAQSLVSGGLPLLEVTLRTDAALAAISAMAAVPGAQVGAGTVLTAADAKAAKNFGNSSSFAG